jgi:membrane associated rhomboid family serine protease
MGKGMGFVFFSFTFCIFESVMRSLRLSIYLSLLFTSLIFWSYYFHGILNWFDVQDWALVPGRWERIYGVFTMVFVHGSLKHFVMNSIPLFVLLAFLFHFYFRISMKVILTIIFLGGAGVFVFAEQGSYHIGASGLVFGLITFLISSGFIRQNKELLIVSFIVILFYGGTLWGILPLQKGVSWEGHLFGALAGLVAALYWRKSGPGRNIYSLPLKQKSQEDEYEQFSS